MFKYWSVLVLCCFISFGSKAQLCITELMQSNVSGLIDDLNNFPDSWVELYNDSDNSINLSDYHIGLKKNVDKAYQLPDKEVAPGEYVIVYCDKEEKGLHTSFRLESNKAGDVFLFKDGEQIQKVSHPAFPAPDIAYGLDPVTGNWGYEFKATPGAQNISGTCDENHILGSPVFDIKGGVFSQPVSLTLSLPSKAPEGVEIRYTLDGSLPSKESLLYDFSSPIEINRSTNVRAALFCEGWLSPFPVTQSYLIPDHEITLPIFSITTDSNNLFGESLGVYKFPYEDWRRPANFEFFEKAGEEAIINQSGEFKISGNSSRQWELKSFALYANKRFGNKMFDYEFFPETRPGRTEFKSILLRNSGNDFYETFMRDAVIQNTVGNAMDIDYQAGRPCVVFINGEYKGMLNIRERDNEDNIYSNYDGLEDVDMFENWTELKEGSQEAMDDIRHFVREEGHTWEEYDEKIDVREFMDVHLANFFYNNTDFPGNNIVAWKPQAEGGKWRLILKDTDYGMGLKFGWGKGLPYDFETLNWLHDPNFGGEANQWGNTKSATAPFVNMENLPSAREDFINRALVYMGDFLNSRTTIVNIDNWYEKIRNEWPYHAELVGKKNGMTKESLHENVEYMKNWIQQRDSFFPIHFAEVYNLGEMAKLEIVQPDKRVKIDYELNGIPLSTGEFNGFYPKGKEIKIAAELDETDSSIIGWKINIEKQIMRHDNSDLAMPLALEDDAEEQEAVTDEIVLNRYDIYEFTYPDDATKVTVQPILDTSNLITDIIVKVIDSETKVPVEGIKINLTGENHNLETISHNDGTAFFEDVEWGDYVMEISDDSFLFEPYVREIMVNGADTDTMVIELTEKVVNPCNLSHTQERNESGLCDVMLRWDMEGFDVFKDSFGYLFHIEVDGEKHGTTETLWYTIRDVEDSKLTVALYAETPSGKITEKIEKEIEIERHPSAGIIDFEDVEGTDWEIYDLNGIKVSSARLAPGIYILKDKNSRKKKIIVR